MKAAAWAGPRARATGCLVLAGLVVLSGAGVAAVAPAGDKAELEAIRKEQRELELKLEAARRRLPPESEAAGAERTLRRIAEVAKLSVELETTPGREVLLLDDGRPSTLRAQRLVVTGRGGLSQLEAFLAGTAAFDSWLRDLESLELEGTGGDDFGVRAQYVFLVEAEPEAPAPSAGRTPPIQRERERLERLRARLRLLEVWGARTKDGRLGAAAALLETLSEPLPARLTRVRVDERIALEGVTVGAAARAALLAGLERAGFAVTRLEAPSAGACRPFALVAVRGARELPMATVSGPGGARAGALCAAVPEPASGRVAVRGAAGGALSIHLRGIALADLALVLHDLTGEGFVVDGDVGGRVAVEVESATLDETLAALGATGLSVGGPPLRRLSRAPVASAAGDFTGEPVTLSFQDADLADVLCVFEEITALRVRVPPALAARANIHVHDLPWDHAFSALIAAAGLGYAIDGTQVFVGPPAAVEAIGRASWPDACDGFAAADGSPVAELHPPAVELGAADLTFLGVASDGEARRGYAYGAGRRILRLAPGDRLYDARVASVDARGVTLALDGGDAWRLAPGP